MLSAGGLHSVGGGWGWSDFLAAGISDTNSPAPIYHSPSAPGEGAGSPFGPAAGLGSGPALTSGLSITDWGALMGIDDLLADPRFSFADGAGYTSVVLDTGIDLDHPYFGDDANGDGVSDRIVYQYDFADNDDDASDKNGHGSNVSGIIGSSSVSFPGIAPGADLIHLKVFSDSGGGTFGMIEDALQWIVANADSYNIVSVNMSLSDSLNHTVEKTRYGIADEIEALANLGITVVSAAGNRYATFAEEGVAYPAADPFSLAVGATYASNIGGPWNYSSGATANTTGPDVIAPFSQRSTTLTDIFAPGAPIAGAGTNGNTTTMHGTSQASPQVAGALLLAQQIADTYLGRWLNLSEIRSLMASTADPIVDGDDEDDNVVNTGATFGRLNMMAFAEAIWALQPTNAAPVLGPITPVGAVVAGETFSVTYDDLLASADVSDEDGDDVSFVITEVLVGSVRVDGVLAVPGTTTVSAGQTITWDAPIAAFGQTSVFSVRAFDGSEFSTQTQSVAVLVNGLPTIDSLAILAQQASADQPYTITYDMLLETTNASDPDGDAIRFVISLLGDGAYTIDGETAQIGSTLEAGQTLIWTPAILDSGETAALLVRADDGVSLSQNTAIINVNVAAAPNPFATAPGASVVGVDNTDGRWIVTRNEQGAVVLFRQSIGQDDWTRIDLSELTGLSDTNTDVVSWADPETGAARFAVATAASLYVLTPGDNDAWSVENISIAVPGARAIASGMNAFTTIDGRIGLAGIDTQGDLVLYLQEATDAGLEWTFENLSQDHLAPRGQETPDFQGPLISYVTSWNALHIAGLDSDGNIRAAWWAPGMPSWRTDNLSAVTNAPALGGGLTAFITEWGAVNLAGVSESGELTVTWWLPTFGADWRTSNLTGGIEGPLLMPTGASSFVTSWGALNIVGQRADGELAVYWWAPGVSDWQVSSLSTVIPGARAPAGSVSGVTGSGGSVMLLGSDENGDVLRFSWTPGGEWAFEDLTPSLGEQLAEQFSQQLAA